MSSLSPWWTRGHVNTLTWAKADDAPKEPVSVYSLTFTAENPSEAALLRKLLTVGKIKTQKLIIHGMKWILDEEWSGIFLECKLSFLELQMAANIKVSLPLANLLKRTLHLKTLILSGCISYQKKDIIDWQLVTPALAANVSLTYLSIGKLPLELDEFEILSTVVAQSKNLLTFHLWNIATVQPQPMCAFIESAILGLVSLNLGGLALKSPGYSALAKVLPGVQLKRLSLWSTSPMSPGCVDFFRALSTNTTISALLFNVNPLQAAEIDALSLALAENNTLDYLDISECSLQHNDIGRLCVGLQKNTTLRTLVADNNGVIARCSPLLDLLRTNRSLTSLSMQGLMFSTSQQRLPVLDAIDENSVIRVLYLSNPTLEDVMRLRGLLLAAHPSMLAFAPRTTAAISEHFTSKKRALGRLFSHLFGGLLQLFISRRAHPLRGSMAALPFELLVQIVHSAMRTLFNINREQVEGMLRLLSVHNVAILQRIRESIKMKKKPNTCLTLIEREQAQMVNGRQIVQVQLNLWPPLA